MDLRLWNNTSLSSFRQELHSIAMCCRGACAAQCSLGLAAGFERISVRHHDDDHTHNV